MDQQNNPAMPQQGKPGEPQGRRRRAISPNSVEAIIFLTVFLAFFGALAWKMGLDNMLNTLMRTSYGLLMETVFYLMSITVLMGALSKLLTEFGVVGLLEKVLRPIMKPIFNLPGIAALGAVVTFLSDNPAIISLSKDRKFYSYFKTYQMVSLTNFGTAFGMGMIVVVTMIGQGFMVSPLIGVVGACVGCVISTRMMQYLTLKAYPEYDKQYKAVEAAIVEHQQEAQEAHEEEDAQQDGLFMRFLNAILDGGKTGVQLGVSIIPGVLIISTMVMMVTFKTTEFTGAAFEGVGWLPWLCDKIGFVFEWLWGFTNTELIAFPVTALGAVGAALGLLPTFNASGLLNANAVAVFTAIGMCWSGYLSTHAAMLDSMGFRKLISRAIASHTVGGAVAGIVAHWLWVLVETLSGGAIM